MQFITESQLAHLIKLSNRTLQSHRQAGIGIPFIKIGSSIRYDLEVVMEYLDKNRFLSTDQVKMCKLNGSVNK